MPDAVWEENTKNAGEHKSLRLDASLNATGDLGFAIPTYVFATPILGGQASASMVAAYGTTSTSLAGTLTGSLTGPGGTVIPFGPRMDSISAAAWGFADVIPQFALRWNTGVDSYMTYVTGDIPVGVYSSSSLANLGIGHGAINTGGGYTYFNPGTGHEFSAVLGFTYNFENQATQYQNGIDMHLDLGAAQFVSKQVLVAWWATSTINSPATAAPPTGSAASNHAWPASDRRIRAIRARMDTGEYRQANGCALL